MTHEPINAISGFRKIELAKVETDERRFVQHAGPARLGERQVIFSRKTAFEIIAVGGNLSSRTDRDIQSGINAFRFFVPDCG